MAWNSGWCHVTWWHHQEVTWVPTVITYVGHCLFPRRPSQAISRLGTNHEVCEHVRTRSLLGMHDVTNQRQQAECFKRSLTMTWGFWSRARLCMIHDPLFFCPSSSYSINSMLLKQCKHCERECAWWTSSIRGFVLALIVDSFLVSSHLFTFCRRSTTVSYPKGKQHRARMPVHVTERKTVEIHPPQKM